MAKHIYQGIDELIGHTPLMALLRYGAGLEATLLAKLEYFNPAGSVKDRVARAMLDDAEARGILHPGAVIVEPTSGNTGIGLAAVAASRGYRVILTMPDTMSVERRKLLQAYGAEVVLTEGARGMQGAIARAKEMVSEMDHAFLPGQFDNPANPAAHYKTTGPEIWTDTNGEVDLFVAGVGTGGTLSGVGNYLKAQNPAIQVVAVEPEDSAVLSGEKAGTHGLQGIGAGFIPQTLDTKVYDQIFRVKDQEAFEASRALARKEGLLVGISSGAALYAATRLARLPENRGKTIVVLLPDMGDRYLSTALFT